FLFAFLLAFASCPPSAAIKCYSQQEQERGGIYPFTRSEVQCGPEIKQCMKMFGERTIFGHYSVSYCASQEHCPFEDDCRNVTIHGESCNLCCCRGDLCNPAAAPTFLLSIAIVSTVIAARL
ncbi:hypothetical protein PRIPAC_91386, partial [Pristionchus pacificus]|uniref:Uncharacterized protein n=1 Tax=Pristionchus pacificus TaxID=54126 RepID=A0A2A6B861_PRIPA